MAKQDITSLINEVKKTEKKVTIQKVIPVKEKKSETLFSLHIPSDKLKQLKLISVQDGVSLKELINSAIDEKYFNK